MLPKRIVTETFSAIASIYYLPRYLGFAPYYFEENNSKQFKSSKIIYNVIFSPIHILLFLTILTYYFGFLKAITHVSDFAYVGMAVYGLSYITQCAYVIIETNIFLRRKYVKLLNKIESNRRKLIRYTVEVDLFFFSIKRKIRVFILIYVVGIITAGMITIKIQYDIYNHVYEIVFISITYINIYIAPVIIFMQCCTGIALYGGLISAINDYLVKCRLEETLPNLFLNMKRLLRLYLEIHDDLMEYNESISALIVVNITAHMIQIIFEMYVTFIPIINRTFSPFIIESIVVIILTEFGVFYCLSVHEYCKLTLIQTRKIVFQLTVDVNDKKIRRELKAFTLALAHLDVELTAKNMFNVDLSLMTKIIAACITYVTLLVQVDCNVDMYYIYLNRQDSFY
ncbi:putative gustatory receptor 28b [Onthophagus taurus]|uniref:putative gustatory receptor 28b n=1 Tax=Onthophagus taurus TaxID=166361 RepID=UPI0039BE7B0E